MRWRCGGSPAGWAADPVVFGEDPYEFLARDPARLKHPAPARRAPGHLRRLHTPHPRRPPAARPAPPRLAALLTQLAAAPVRQPCLHGDGTGPNWLFPGLVPGRPISATGFSRKLLEHGIDSRPARDAAIIALVDAIPPRSSPTSSACT